MIRKAIDRRTLFATGAALAAGSSLVTTRARAAVPRAPSLKIGLASYSMRKQSLDQVIDLCGKAGIHYITLKDMHLPRTASAEDFAAIRGKLEAAKIELTGGGVINIKGSDEAQIRKDFEYARAAKLPMMVASPAPESLDLVEKLAKEFDMKVAIHNHGPEDKYYQTPREVMAAIKKRDKRLGVCMDIGHTVRGGADPVKCVAECGDRLMDLHIKDLKNVSDKGSQVEVGKGAIDIVGLLRALARRRFAGSVALEYEINADDPIAGIRESLGYMRGVAAAVG